MKLCKKTFITTDYLRDGYRYQPKGRVGQGVRFLRFSTVTSIAPRYKLNFCPLYDYSSDEIFIKLRKSLINDYKF